jgi:hypothetical protein
MKIEKRGRSKFLRKTAQPPLRKTRKGDGFAADLFQRSGTTKDADDQTNIIVLTASDDDEESNESLEFLHGEFTYFLLLGLQSNDINEDEDVSAEEAYAYLYPVIRDYSIYTVTPQLYDGTVGEVSLAEPTTGRTVFIGDIDNFVWGYPFNTYWKKSRAEYIYYPSQIGPAGYIQKLKIFASEIPGMSLNNCTIRMTHTSRTEYDYFPEWTSAGWTTVYSGTKTISNVGPVSFELSTPFYYDGVSNLIVDFSFSNDDWIDRGEFYGSFSDMYCMIFHRRDDDSYGEPTTWTGTSPEPTRDENPPTAAGSYLHIEFEFESGALQRPEDTLCFAQLAVGGGYEVVLLIENHSDSAWTGRAEPLNKGQSFEFLMTDIDLLPGETKKYVFTGGSSVLATGLELFGDTGNPTSVLSVAYFFNYFIGGSLVDSTGAPKGQASKTFTLPVEETATVSTGIAIRRLPNMTESPITLKLRDAEGVQIGEETKGSDFAEFVWQTFSGVPNEFIGSMTVESDTDFYMMVLRMEDQPGGGVQYTSCPPEPR